MAAWGVVSWITTHVSELLQDLSIIVGFAFTVHAIHRDAAARRIGNLLELTKQHNELWGKLNSPELARISDEGAALDTKPLSHEEQRFVTALILHLHVYFRAMRVKMYPKLEGLDADVKQFFSRPIPKAVWNSVKQYQNKDFVEFIEDCIEGEPSR